MHVWRAPDKALAAGEEEPLWRLETTLRRGAAHSPPVAPQHRHTMCSVAIAPLPFPLRHRLVCTGTAERCSLNTSKYRRKALGDIAGSGMAFRSDLALLAVCGGDGAGAGAAAAPVPLDCN